MKYFSTVSVSADPQGCFFFFFNSEFSELRTDFCFWPPPFIMRSRQRGEMEANSRTQFPFSPAHPCQWLTPGRNFTSTHGQPLHFFPKPKTSLHTHWPLLSIYITATYLFLGNLFLIYFGDSISCIPGWSQSGHVAEDNLELIILLLPPPECWDYRHMSPLMVFKVLEMEPRGLCKVGKHPSYRDTSPACRGRGKYL